MNRNLGGRERKCEKEKMSEPKGVRGGGGRPLSTTYTMKAWKYTPKYPQSLRTALVLGLNSVTTTLHIRHKQPFRRRKPGTATKPSPPSVPLPSVGTRLDAREPWVLGRRRHQHPRQEGPEARPRPNARYQDAAAAIAAAAAPSSYNNAGDSLIIRPGHYMEWRGRER